eukprot:CAMPEP_0195520698 /NCGR_PEP_ID=MMETSP0794_2-20130614/17447_1 /TAXON_ID=515487 /ORGANISM="Stephanopyxis turris, Strain CCMP 815" /LENGTH=52 /DNA_ID=CAMNT_0040650111 /DNA_START=90 /DNA_END=245 /DNA_ORIENTATION=+
MKESGVAIAMKMPEHPVHDDRNIEAEFVRFKMDAANALAAADDNRIRVQQLE